MKRVLVIAAHPDDEILGAGGTIAKHVKQGDKVSVLILGRGLAARGVTNETAFDALEEQCRNAHKVLGVTDVLFENFPDNAFDSVPLIKIIQAIETIKEKVNPERVLTHAKSDLNIDHRSTFEAVMTAFRPLPHEVCQEILCFEVLSATGWRGEEFTPTVFENISNELIQKTKALECYTSEMRSFPHARSIEAVEALARFRGASVGVDAAEAFVPARIIY